MTSDFASPSKRYSRNQAPRHADKIGMHYEQVHALALALLMGRSFVFEDLRGLRYRATRDVLLIEEIGVAVAAGDAYEVAYEMVRIGVRDLRGRILVRS